MYKSLYPLAFLTTKIPDVFYSLLQWRRGVRFPGRKWDSGGLLCFCISCWEAKSRRLLVFPSSPAETQIPSNYLSRVRVWGAYLDADWFWNCWLKWKCLIPWREKYGLTSQADLQHLSVLPNTCITNNLPQRVMFLNVLWDIYIFFHNFHTIIWFNSICADLTFSTFSFLVLLSHLVVKNVFLEVGYSPWWLLWIIPDRFFFISILLLSHPYTDFINQQFFKSWDL